MTFERGDVVVVLFPDSNLRTAKPRPGFVVQADHLGSGLPQLIIAMISSNPVRLGHPSRVPVRIATTEGQQSGLKLDSVIMTDNLQTVLETRIHRTIGQWSDMAAVDAALRHTLGL